MTTHYFRKRCPRHRTDWPCQVCDREFEAHRSRADRKLERLDRQVASRMLPAFTPDPQPFREIMIDGEVFEVVWDGSR